MLRHEPYRPRQDSTLLGSPADCFANAPPKREQTSILRSRRSCKLLQGRKWLETNTIESEVCHRMIFKRATCLRGDHSTHSRRFLLLPGTLERFSGNVAVLERGQAGATFAPDAEKRPRNPKLALDRNRTMDRTRSLGGLAEPEQKKGCGCTIA